MRPGDLGTPRSWLIPIGVGVAAYAVASHGLIQVGVQTQLPLLVGLTVGLAAATPLQGAIVSAVCVVLGMLLAPPLAPNGVAALPGAGSFASFAIAAVLAAAAGAVPPIARHRVEGAARQNVTVAISAVLVASAVANLWLPFAATGLPTQGYGPITVGLANQVPVPGQYQSDSAVYRRVFYLMHEGRAYYPAFHDAYAGLGPDAVPLNSPVTVRLPTYFWLLVLLPPEGFAILYAFFAFASVGVVACALIAGQIVGPRLAPIAALSFAAYVSGVSHTGGVFAVDLPSVCIALAGVALFLLATRTRSAYTLWGAVAVMVAAALMREILVYLPVFAALSAALEPRRERLRMAVPWLVGLAVFALAYTAHAVAVWPYLAHGAHGFTYLHGGLAFVSTASRASPTASPAADPRSSASCCWVWWARWRAAGASVTGSRPSPRQPSCFRSSGCWSWATRESTPPAPSRTTGAASSCRSRSRCGRPALCCSRLAPSRARDQAARSRASPLSLLGDDRLGDEVAHRRRPDDAVLGRVRARDIARAPALDQDAVDRVGELVGDRMHIEAVSQHELDESSIASGLATPWPAMSGAEPWLGS